MNYLELTIQVDSDFAEILVAELAEIGFDSFVDIEDGLQAYITEEDFKDQALKWLMEEYAVKTSLSYSLKKIAKENWNEEWEKNFSPITVTDQIYVRATFHEPDPAFPLEIVITPKMSFGTGHHETTSQVMELQLGINHQNKTVLDVGTGTGILAILAEKLGAVEISAFDIDEWSVENTLENVGLNDCKHITTRLGTIDDEPPKQYDIVLANINRNILLREIPLYVNFMKENATLIISGFYENDIADIQEVAEKSGLKKLTHLSKNNWAAVVFIKQ